MIYVKNFDQIPAQIKGSVLALGNFDGFHRGHQVVVATAGRLAKRLNASLSVMTMEPHPRTFFAPDQEAFRITPATEKAQILAEFGIDSLLELPFGKATSSMTAEEFMQKILVDALDVKGVVVGYDYHFGQKRSGNVETLQAFGAEKGFEVVVVEPVSIGVEGAAGEVYSSTLVRQALKNGEVRRAAALLGHWWTHSSIVQKGDQRGRTIQFPTANLSFGDSIVPKFGVYAVRATVGEDQNTIYSGVANIGVRPTFDKTDVLLEVHLFDFKEDIYDQSLNVEFVSFIRPEQKFDGLDSLKTQITKDCGVAKTVLADPENQRVSLRVPHIQDVMKILP